MDFLEAARFYFWAIVGGLSSLFLLCVAIASFCQGARRDALALALLALALALLSAAQFTGAVADRGWLNTIIGLSGFALFALVARYWKSKPDLPPMGGASGGAQTRRHRNKPTRDNCNKPRHK